LKVKDFKEKLKYWWNEKYKKERVIFQTGLIMVGLFFVVAYLVIFLSKSGAFS